MFDAPTKYSSGGFEQPPGVCQSCNEKSDWRMIKVHQQGGSWRAAYAHNVLTGYESGKQVDWSRVQMKGNLRFEGWLEFCNRCEAQPIRFNCTTITQEEIDAHKNADIESIRKMLAEGVINELPYDKNKRGGEI
jgi:hypothetical protein